MNIELIEMGRFIITIIIAAMTALFIGVSFMLSVEANMAIACAINLFAHLHSDNMLLSMSGTFEIDKWTAPNIVGFRSMIILVLRATMLVQKGASQSSKYKAMRISTEIYSQPLTLAADQ